MGRDEMVRSLTEATRLIDERKYREADLLLAAVNEQLKKNLADKVKTDGYAAAR